MDTASGDSQTPPVPAGPPTAAAAQFPPKLSAAAAAANPTTAPLRRQVFAAPRASTAPNSTAMAPSKTKGPRPAAKPKAAGSKRPPASSASVPSPTPPPPPPPRSRKKAAVGRGKQPAATMDNFGQFVVTPPPPPPPPVVEELATPYAPPADRNVVDEMTQSVDDETFLQSMHVGLAGYMSQDTPSQEYETQVEDEEEEDEDVLAEEGLDLDDEGFLDEAPRGRTVNYNAEEDKLICTAWKKIGLDPAVGTEQPKDAYWHRMTEYFHAHTTSGITRTLPSIRHRWKTISMGGVIPSNTTHVDDHGNGGETPKEDGNNSNRGNGDTVVVEP